MPEDSIPWDDSNPAEVSNTLEPILTEDGNIKLLQASPYAWVSFKQLY
jgi:hypothetical protein